LPTTAYAEAVVRALDRVSAESLMLSRMVQMNWYQSRSHH
jgi:hypothetical protein